jgi:caffeoyl-CoA O-methyltransferase
MKTKTLKFMIVILCLCLFLIPDSSLPQEAGRNLNRDIRVKKFLEKRQGTWRDLNIPMSDGKILYDIIVRNRYQRALEIGTSTGLSAIFIAWALSKTGGKLITIEIDGERHREALANFREAGLADIIDARLADAHDLVGNLPGTFDFVFCDADKEWYKNYFIAVYPKLENGGCYTAHNVSTKGWGGGEGVREFYAYIRKLPALETTVDESGAGLSISFKRAGK